MILQEARSLFTQAVMAVYDENIAPASFLRSFFETRTFTTKEISTEVRRGTEKIAVDVIRGTDGNRNQFTRFSEKIYVPPFYNEYFDITSLDRYDRAFGEPANINPATVGYLANDVGMKIAALRDKIDRAKEKQVAQVFETGIVELKNGDNIDFKRKAESLVDVGSGNYWDAVDAPIEQQLVDAAKFMRNVGKNTVPVLTLILSSDAWIALKASNYFKDNANYVKVSLLDVGMPSQVASTGAVYHGRISAGAHIYNVYTYDEVYEDADGNIVSYLPSNKAIILPTQGQQFILSHAGVPAILADTANAEFPEYIGTVSAEYYINNYIERKRKAHIFEIYSAPLPVPVTVDQIYTMQVLA